MTQADLARSAQLGSVRIISGHESSYDHLVTGVSIANSPISDSMNNRTRQQGILPNAVANRYFGSLVSTSQLTYGSIFLSTAVSATFTAKVVDNTRRVIFAIPQSSVYIGISSPSQIAADGSNQWPTATVGGGSFPVYFNPFDWGQSDGTNQVTRVTARNNTGSSQLVLFVTKWKILTVPASAPTQSTAVLG